MWHHLHSFIKLSTENSCIVSSGRIFYRRPKYHSVGPIIGAETTNRWLNLSALQQFTVTTCCVVTVNCDFVGSRANSDLLVPSESTIRHLVPFIITTCTCRSAHLNFWFERSHKHDIFPSCLFCNTKINADLRLTLQGKGEDSTAPHWAATLIQQ